MSDLEHSPARLAARPAKDGILVVEIAGNWLDRSALPNVAAVAQELAGSGVQTLAFDAHGLGRWDSALLVRILALSDLCAQGKVGFRTETLPEGLARASK